MSQTKATKSGHSFWKGLFTIVLLIYGITYICGFGSYMITTANAKAYEPPYTSSYGYTINPCISPCWYNGRLLYTQTAYEHFVVQYNLNQSKYFKGAITNTVKTPAAVWGEEEHNPKAAAILAVLYWYIIYMNSDFISQADQIIGTCSLPDNGFYASMTIGNWLIPHWQASCY
jgi:hypothetical protein